MRFTIIVPLRLLPGAGRDRRRLYRLMRALPENVEAVVVDDTPCMATRSDIAALLSRFPRARHLESQATSGDAFAIGRLRDLGAAAAPDGAIMFHDVDFIASTATYRRLATFAAAFFDREGRNAFFCAPVAFLTPLGTASLRTAPGRVWRRLVASGSRAPAALADRVVLGSSAIAIRREALLDSGGHCGQFSGHGAEDFELMHRLSARYPQGGRPQDYLTDFGSRLAAERGFRAYFARYARAPLAEGLMLAHQWHPPRRADPRYHAARDRNFARLREAMRSGPAG